VGRRPGRATGALRVCAAPLVVHTAQTGGSRLPGQLRGRLVPSRAGPNASLRTRAVANLRKQLVIAFVPTLSFMLLMLPVQVAR
jgi:hypothetical protein